MHPSQFCLCFFLSLCVLVALWGFLGGWSGFGLEGYGFYVNDFKYPIEVHDADVVTLLVALYITILCRTIHINIIS